MPRSPRPLASRLWRFFLTVSLVLGLLLAGVSLATRFADRLREPLATALTTRLGLVVHLSGLHLGLVGLMPRITLEDVDLISPGDPIPQLHLRRLHLDLDPLASLGTWSPQVTDITLVGPRLRLELREDGQLVIAGLGEGGGDGETDDRRALAFFLAQGRLRLTEGELEWLDRRTQAPPLILSEIRLDLDNRGAAHRLELEARLASHPEAWLRVTADLQGDAGTPYNWSGVLDFTLRAGGLGPPTAGLLPHGLQFAEDLLTLEGHYRIQSSRLAEGQARLNLEGLSIQGQIPGQGPLRLEAARLDLDLTTDQTVGGRLQIAGEGLNLSLPGVFGDRPPIQLDRLAGPLTWVPDPDGGLQLASEGLDALNPDLGLNLRFTLRNLGAAAPAGPVLEIQADIRNANAGVIRDYLPDAKLKPRARAWLERAFPAGRVPRGQVLFQGRLADFPFRENQGYFHVLLWVEAMALDFHPDWPPLEGLEGLVHFHNQAMSIATIGGDILGFPLLEAQAEILDLADAHVVTVRGAARGDFDQSLDFPGATPLRASLGGIPDLFRATGLVQVDLDMDIPLGHDHPEDQLRLAGALSWPGPASLTLTSADLVFADLSGVLRFSQDGVTTSRIEAQSLGAPLSVALDRIRPDKGLTKLTELKLTGTTAVKALAKRLPHPLWRHLEGQIPWELNIRVPDPRAPKGISALQADFSLVSNLQGLAVKLPQPVGMTRAETRPLSLNWQSQAGKDTQVRGRYGDLALNLLFARDGKGRQALRRGAVSLGEEQVDLPGADGWRLTGHLPELDLNAWWDWSAGLTGAGLMGGLRWTVADFGIDRLQVGPAQLQAVRLDLEQSAQAWELRVQAQELAGRLSIPFRTRSQPLRAEFERLDLKPLLGYSKPNTAGGPTTPKDSLMRDDPRQAQPLELVVDQLRWSDNELGRLTLRAAATDQGLTIEELRLAGSPRIQLTGTGAWALENSEPWTRLDLDASTSDLGELLRHLDYASYLEQAPAGVLARLSWPGGPADLNLATLEGEVEVKIGKGSLLEVDPGVGRVLGVLNLGALGRRLSLDFTDLFDRGFVFEGITGKLGIHAGRVEMRDPLVIEGSAAEIRISGRANLIDETLDQVATVTPSLGGGVALASAIVAGPLVGAAVLLADKASGGALDVIGRHSYDIRGPWANPDIVPRARLTFPSSGEAPAGAVVQETPVQQTASDDAAPGSTRPEPEGNAFLDQP
ncbi:MAG: AsmA-like C-terminal region-containing protein [Chromatiaceae bacterium]